MLVRLGLAAIGGTIDAEIAVRCRGSPAQPSDAAAISPVRDAIRARISEVYRQEGGNISAARRLGASRNAVYRAVCGTGSAR